MTSNRVVLKKLYGRSIQCCQQDRAGELIALSICCDLIILLFFFLFGDMKGLSSHADGICLYMKRIGQ